VYAQGAGAVLRAGAGTPGGGLQEVRAGEVLLGFVGGRVQQSRMLHVRQLRMVTQLARWQVVVQHWEQCAEEGRWV